MCLNYLNDFFKFIYLKKYYITKKSLEDDSFYVHVTSGYFSGDEFRSCYNNNNNFNEIHNNQFNINKFLNTQRQHADVLDDFDSMYRRIDLENKFSPINIHLEKEIDQNKSYELIEDIKSSNNNLMLDNRSGLYKSVFNLHNHNNYVKWYWNA